MVVVLREGTTIATVPDITIAATMMAATIGATRGRPVPDPLVAIDSSRVEEVPGSYKIPLLAFGLKSSKVRRSVDSAEVVALSGSNEQSVNLWASLVLL